MALPSEDLEKLITDQTRQNFINKYGSLLDLRPDAMFGAVSDQMVNPTYLQKTSDAMSEYDRAFARAGGSRSRGLQAKRAGYMTDLDLKRKEAVNQYMESQKDLFNKWYTQEMYNYQTSKAPSAYTLSKYGLGQDTGIPDYTVSKTAPRYEYKTPYDVSSIFKYGGYSKPRELYGKPTLMPVTPI